MKKLFLLAAFAIFTALKTITGETSLTIYNNFAVIRDSLKLDLKTGTNEVRYSDVALFAEPSSMILRDPTGKTELQIQEQAFRGKSVSEETMLAWFEGRTIDFIRHDEGKTSVVPGKIIRSGRLKLHDDGRDQKEPAIPPIIEVDGKTQFELPGTARFPSLPGDKTLKTRVRLENRRDQSNPV